VGEKKLVQREVKWNKWKNERFIVVEMHQIESQAERMNADVWLE